MAYNCQICDGLGTITDYRYIESEDSYVSLLLCSRCYYKSSDSILAILKSKKGVENE